MRVEKKKKNLLSSDEKEVVSPTLIPGGKKTLYAVFK